MTTAPALSIIIVSYNTRAMTLACLDSIAAETRDVDYEVIVVDNASSDGSAEAIGSHPAVTRLIARDDNIGFARANNLAAEHCRGGFILLLNPDTLVLDGAIDRLVAFARRRPEAMIWGGRTLFADGRLNPTSVYARMTLWRVFCRAVGLTGLLKASAVFNGEAIGAWQRDSEREVDIVTGCLLLTTRDLWHRLGGFDPIYFMYGEEVDLCLRARLIGARPAMTAEATIVHYGGASEATREGKMVKLLAAKATLIDRHFPLYQRRVGLALNAAWPLGRWLALAAWSRLTGEGRQAAAAGVWRAVWRRRDEWRHGYRREDAGPPIAVGPALTAG
ncbi:MAG: glycosyltransferase family 2 protein [Hyphomicrobiaceae bacterium]|nr:glycosyltransferase family 2 protein [Hyphomicrobiaceae bacterium]